ncbi:MAG: hypothetical protein AAGD25_10870 [Cyanobacteria bacterium P01_F01_bin.150]
MSIKVGHVSVSTIVEKYSSEKIKDLEANPPADILREQASIENHKDSFAKLYAEQQEKEKEMCGYYGTSEILVGGKPFKERFPELAAYMEDLGQPDPVEFVSAVDQRRYGGWYGKSKVYFIEQDWRLEDRELELSEYSYDYQLTIMPALYQRAKGFIEKIKQDQADIKNLKEQYAQKIKAEADKKVREAMQALATEESYDLIYDPSEVVMVALNAADVTDKVSAKVV